MIPDAAETGYDIPARPGDRLAAIATPALVIDLEAFERNLARMRAYVESRGLALRAHAKTHKSADISRIQMQRGGAVGICCQKVSEAEALVRGGVGDVLVSNQIYGAARAKRLAQLAKIARVAVCVDDETHVAAIASAAQSAGTEIGVLIEIDCGGGRCGTQTPQDTIALARQILSTAGLRFEGIQAYQGRMQHFYALAERRSAAQKAAEVVQQTLDALSAAGIACPKVTGAGTGSFELEGSAGVLTEIQCGSYVFGDADYAKVEGGEGSVFDSLENALFVLAEVMSRPVAGRVICDAGHKSYALDSGPPVPVDPDLRFRSASDEHGSLEDPTDKLRLGDRVWLIPGHCDPTCNLHDWFVGVRGDVVECLWPVTARGKLF